VAEALPEVCCGSRGRRYPLSRPGSQTDSGERRSLPKRQPHRPSAALLPEIVFSANDRRNRRPGRSQFSRSQYSVESQFSRKPVQSEASSVEASSVEAVPSEPAATGNGRCGGRAAGSNGLLPARRLPPETAGPRRSWSRSGRPGGRFGGAAARDTTATVIAPTKVAQTVAAGEAGRRRSKHERHRRGRRERPDFRKTPRRCGSGKAWLPLPPPDGAAVREAAWRNARIRPRRALPRQGPATRTRGAERDKGKFGGGAREERAARTMVRDKGGSWTKGGSKTKREGGPVAPAIRPPARGPPPGSPIGPIDPQFALCQTGGPSRRQLSANRKELISSEKVWLGAPASRQMACGMRGW